MSKLGDAVLDITSETLTENGCKTYSTSLNNNVDMFFRAPAMRGRNDDVVNLFQKAYIENNELALANLFYLRDCRKGVGERDLTRSIFKFLVTSYPNIITNEFIDKLVNYGRYDDILYALTNNKTNPVVIAYIKDKLNNNDSLLAKWLPSANATSKKTIAYAKMIIKGLGISPTEYRKTLSKLRKEQHLLETTMTNKDYTNIQYEHIPSQAHRKHTKAFYRNDEENYSKYLESVQKGEKTINTTTITPVEIVSNYFKDSSFHANRPLDDTSLDTLWNNLPDMFEGRSENSLVVCDVSGSMYSGVTQTKPICVSTSLALYIAERNKGMFHNEYISFSNKPQLIKVKGKDLFEKINYILHEDMGYDTNVEAVFDCLLQACVKNKLSEEECPRRIYIISDMEFNECSIGGLSVTAYECIKHKYEQAGYKMPQLFFWNVNSRGSNVPVRYDESGTALISGYSPNILRYVLGKEDISPEKIMMEVLKNYL